MINALIVSGLPTKEFNFLGFLPLNKKLRKEKLNEIEKSEKTIIIYEAPHKMKSTLLDLKNILKNRKIVLARELTKIGVTSPYETPFSTFTLIRISKHFHLGLESIVTGKMLA